MNLLFKEALS